MKRLIVPLLLAVGVTLAVIIGQRMSTDAMAVVIGVAVGIAASVPTSPLLVALLRRERATWHGAWQTPEMPKQLPAPQPQIVVLQQPVAATYTPQPPVFGLNGGTPRLSVIGEDGGDL